MKSGSITGHAAAQTNGSTKSAGDFPPKRTKNPTYRNVNKAPVMYDPRKNILIQSPD